MTDKKDATAAKKGKGAAANAGEIDVVKAGKDAEKLIKQTKAVIKALEELDDTIEPHKDELKNKAVAVKQGIASKLVSAKDRALSPVKDFKSSHDMKKFIRESKQNLLEHASYTTTAASFLKLMEDSGKAKDAVGIGMSDAPGCYVLATYAKFDNDKDLTDYRGVFVGGGENVGEEIVKACSRAGNPDVYADVKYGQNVHLYIYSCGVDSLEEKRQAIISVLQAKESYNAPIEKNC